MNPGPLEAGGKVAAGFMDAMKSQPLALALVMCNVLLLGLFFYVIKIAASSRSREFTSIMEMQREVQKLLYNCTPDRPGGTSFFLHDKGNDSGGNDGDKDSGVRLKVD